LIAVDTSALVAITNHEPERARFPAVLASEDRRLVSAVTLLETWMVTYGRFGAAGIERMEAWFDVMPLEVVSFDDAQARTAYLAFTRYGKGINPQARLNFCDCVAYALAKTFNVPLLYKGDDFLATDARSAA